METKKNLLLKGICGVPFEEGVVMVPASEASERIPRLTMRLRLSRYADGETLAYSESG